VRIEGITTGEELALVLKRATGLWARKRRISVVSSPQMEPLHTLVTLRGHHRWSTNGHASVVSPWKRWPQGRTQTLVIVSGQRSSLGTQLLWFRGIYEGSLPASWAAHEVRSTHDDMKSQW
jgi:hypothetical protein